LTFPSKVRKIDKGSKDTKVSKRGLEKSRVGSDSDGWLGGRSRGTEERRGQSGTSSRKQKENKKEGDVKGTSWTKRKSKVC